MRRLSGSWHQPGHYAKKLPPLSLAAKNWHRQYPLKKVIYRKWEKWTYTLYIHDTVAIYSNNRSVKLKKSLTSAIQTDLSMKLCARHCLPPLGANSMMMVLGGATFYVCMLLHLLTALSRPVQHAGGYASNYAKLCSKPSPATGLNLKCRARNLKLL